MEREMSFNIMSSVERLLKKDFGPESKIHNKISERYFGDILNFSDSALEKEQKEIFNSILSEKNLPPRLEIYRRFLVYNGVFSYIVDTAISTQSTFSNIPFAQKHEDLFPTLKKLSIVESVELCIYLLENHFEFSSSIEATLKIKPIEADKLYKDLYIRFLGLSRDSGLPIEKVELSKEYRNFIRLHNFAITVNGGFND